MKHPPLERMSHRVTLGHVRIIWGWYRGPLGVISGHFGVNVHSIRRYFVSFFSSQKSPIFT